VFAFNVGANGQSQWKNSVPSGYWNDGNNWTIQEVLQQLLVLGSVVGDDAEVRSGVGRNA